MAHRARAQARADERVLLAIFFRVADAAGRRSFVYSWRLRRCGRWRRREEERRFLIYIVEAFDNFAGVDQSTLVPVPRL